MIFLNKKRGILSVFVLLLIITFPLVQASESYIKANNQLMAKSDNDQNKISYYQLDFMGNVRTEFNDDGVQQPINYFPFGKATNAKLTRTLGYKSSVYDKDTNLYSTYDAENGRFIVPSAVLDQFNSQSLNPYSFRKNNPFRDVTSEAVTPDLTIPERQDGTEGSSVSSDQTLSQKWEKQIYVPKISYSLIKSAIQTVYMMGDILLTQLEPNVQKIPKMDPLLKMNYEGPDRVPYGPIDAEFKPRNYVPNIEVGRLKFGYEYRYILHYWATEINARSLLGTSGHYYDVKTGGK